MVSATTRLPRPPRVLEIVDEVARDEDDTVRIRPARRPRPRLASVEDTVECELDDDDDDGTRFARSADYATDDGGDGDGNGNGGAADFDDDDTIEEPCVSVSSAEPSEAGGA